MTTTNLIEDCYNLAHKFHAGQYRKDGKTPYIFHCVEVMRFLQKELGVEDEEILGAALLHDTIEDSNITSYDIANTISDRVGEIVDELIFYPDSCSKQKYIESFKDKRDEALIIKCADRICNTKDFFYSSDQNYALKYLEKANCLFDFIKDRIYIRANVKLAVLDEKHKLEEMISQELKWCKGV